MLYEQDCVYGLSDNPDIVFIYASSLYAWYCINESCNVGKCYLSSLEAATRDGVVHVEEIEDIDFCSSCEPITSLDELEEFIDS